MRQRFGWAANSKMPDRYANRAMSDAASVNMLEFHEELLQALAAKRQQQEKKAQGATVNNNTVYQQVGDAAAQWEEDSPLLWTMKETLGKGQNRRVNEVTLDLRPLASVYGLKFLLALKAGCARS